MENIVYNELKRRRFNVDVGVVELREKDESGKEKRKQLEIDFVANLGSKRFYIQSAYEIPNEEKMQQEIKSLKNTKDSFQKIILVEKTAKPRYDENGFLIMGVKEFLLDENVLN